MTAAIKLIMGKGSPAPAAANIIKYAPIASSFSLFVN